MKKFSLSSESQLQLASQMLFPPQLPLRENRQLSLLKETPANDRKRLEQIQARERRAAVDRQNQSDRRAYVIDRRVADFLQMVSNEQKRFEDAKAAGRYVVPQDAQQHGTIELVPHSTIEDGFTTIVAPSEQLMSIFQRVPALIHGRTEEASLRGQLAGAVLYYLYHLKTYKISGGSLSSARRICLERANRIYHRVPGRPEGGSESLLKGLRDESLEDWWGEYRPVAHWWAAYVSLDSVALLPESVLIKEGNLEHLIRRARFFARFGTNSFTSNPNRLTPLWPEELIWPPGISAIAVDDKTDDPGQFLSAEVRKYIKSVLRIPA